MADEKRPVDHLLDLLVFAPLGLVCESRSLFPKLVEEGRTQITTRIQVARMVGQFAVKKGQREAAKAMERQRSAARPEPAEPPAGATAARTAPAAAHDIVIPLRDDLDDEEIAEADLAIPSYSSLAASQVVSRLDGLAPVELEAVRRYEVAHRGRKTVLGKIAMLQSAAGQ
ncbi:MAG TPA: hypothetical protein VKD67_11105 [Acidimicrobiales bacterium]|nr:hypothetical protein [Acidimicrobiales bacterium]